MDTLSATKIYPQPSSWMALPRPNPDATFRLFCYPYAGAGAVVFRTWPAGLPDEVEVVSVQLPGRENRHREAPYENIQPLLDALSPQIESYLDLPFAFYGHSLGALLAFEMTRQLRRQGASLPVHLFLSSRRAPHIPDHNPPIHSLQDQAFVEAIQQRYNGIPEVILADPELVALFIPLLRADLSILETYHYAEEPPLPIPISVYGGTQDPNVTHASLAAWQQHTAEALSIQMFPGDHFFIQSQREPLLNELSKELTSYLR